MNRRTRVHAALISTLPTALTIPACCLLAAFGVVPWSVPIALPIALAVHAVISYVRLSAVPTAAASGHPNTG